MVSRVDQRLGAVLTCPSCGREFPACWAGDRETADRQCPSCGRVFEATWPGFTFEPETVIIDSPEDADATERVLKAAGVRPDRAREEAARIRDETRERRAQRLAPLGPSGQEPGA